MGDQTAIAAANHVGTIGHLRDICARLRDGRALTALQVDLLVDGIGGFLDALDDGGSASLDRSMGLRKRGGVSVAREDALLRRDELIRQLWQEHDDWRHLQPNAAARMMRIDAERYEKLRWPRERDCITAPSAEPACTWWRVLSTGGSIPGTKRLQQILNG